MTKKPSEHEIQTNILIEANKRGHRLWRSNAGRIETKHGAWINLFPKGYPDLTGFRKEDGKFVVIEVKDHKGKLSKEQKDFQKFIETQPVIYGVARSKEDAIRIIEQ